MAVLKSFDLKGNKQSFANWISNLSPTETPFTSMIGKAPIEATQYSWQTDQLSPADKGNYKEGSEVESQVRRPTDIITNFTQIFRKVVVISDAAKKISTYGRDNELNYQMGKSGKELMRDLEFANLGNITGRPSTSAQSGKFYGFEGLVAGLSVPDNDTGAVVHKKITTAAGPTPSLNPSDIFDMTYNLYLANSSADMIMFHPKYAIAFSGLIQNNTESKNTFRMFDGVEEKFNIQVNKIRDPLGRTYTLLPNRLMPQDRIFFFNASDWTQTILRTPQTSALGKFGSSDRQLMEMEVGLRHRHPYASGVLELIEKGIGAILVTDDDPLIAGVNDHKKVETTVIVDEEVVENAQVSWFTSDPEIAYFEDRVTPSNSEGTATNYLIAGERAGKVLIWSVVMGVKSNKKEITVIPPTMELDVTETTPTEGEEITVSLTASYGQGSDKFFLSGVDVHWNCHPANGVSFTENVTSTNETGVASVTVIVNTTEEVWLWGTIGEFKSEYIALNYVARPAAVNLEAKSTDTTIVGNILAYVAEVVDHEGKPIEGQEVTWTVSDDRIGKLSAVKTVTNMRGETTVYVEGLLMGHGSIVAHTTHHSSAPKMFFFGEGATINVASNDEDNTITVGTPIEMSVSVLSVNGVGVPDVPVHFSIDKGDPIPSGMTNSEGILQEVIHTAAVGTYHVTVFVDGFRYKEVITFIVEDAPLPPDPEPEPEPEG